MKVFIYHTAQTGDPIACPQPINLTYSKGINFEDTTAEVTFNLSYLPELFDSYLISPFEALRPWRYCLAFIEDSQDVFCDDYQEILWAGPVIGHKFDFKNETVTLKAVSQSAWASVNFATKNRWLTNYPAVRDGVISLTDNANSVTVQRNSSLGVAFTVFERYCPHLTNFVTVAGTANRLTLDGRAMKTAREYLDEYLKVGNVAPFRLFTQVKKGTFYISGAVIRNSLREFSQSDIIDMGEVEVGGADWVKNVYVYSPSQDNKTAVIARDKASTSVLDPETFAIESVQNVTKRATALAYAEAQATALPFGSVEFTTTKTVEVGDFILLRLPSSLNEQTCVRGYVSSLSTDSHNVTSVTLDGALFFSEYDSALLAPLSASSRDKRTVSNIIRRNYRDLRLLSAPRVSDE